MEETETVQEAVNFGAWRGLGLTSPGRLVELLHDLRFLPAFFLACFLAFLIGCGKQKTPSPPGAEAVSTVDQVSTVLTELTQLVRKYSVEQRKAPKSLDELVAKGYLDSVPQAPNGKRFAINKDLQVYLSEP